MVLLHHFDTYHDILNYYVYLFIIYLYILEYFGDKIGLDLFSVLSKF
jgi:hypothetical protein